MCAFQYQHGGRANHSGRGIVRKEGLTNVLQSENRWEGWNLAEHYFDVWHVAKGNKIYAVFTKWRFTQGYDWGLTFSVFTENHSPVNFLCPATTTTRKASRPYPPQKGHLGTEDLPPFRWPWQAEHCPCPSHCQVFTFSCNIISELTVQMPPYTSRLLLP